MKKMKPFVSVVVVGFNGEKFIAQLLESLESQSYPRNRFEVILVDNASTDNTSKIAESFQKAEIIQLKENTGFAAGNNEGIKKSKGEFVVLVSQDVWVEKNFLSELVKTMQEKPEAGIVGAAEHPYDGTIPKAKKIVESSWMGGGAMMIRRKALEEELFDENYFAYCEDMDLSWRMKMKGWRIFLNTASIWHHAGFDRSDISSWAAAIAIRNRVLLLLTYGSMGQIIKSINFMGTANSNSSREKNNSHKNRGSSSREKKKVSSLSLFFSVLPLLPSTIAKRFSVMQNKKVSQQEIDSWIRETDKQLWGKES